MPNHVPKEGTRTSAIFAALLTVFLAFGVAGTTVASADPPDEGTQTESPSPTVTTTPSPSAEPTESPAPATTSPNGDESVPSAEASPSEGDAVGGEESADEDETPAVQAGIHVTVSADVETIVATGEDVTFTFVVRNTSNASLQITALNGGAFGSLSGDADCQVGTTLNAGTSCSFTLIKHLSGTVGTTFVGVVTATGQVAGTVVSDVDSAVCLFVSGEQETTGGIRVTKTANVDAVPATGGDVTFTFAVKNTAEEQLEITGLSDDVFGSLAGDADCEVGTMLDPNGSCSFTLTKHLAGTVGEHHVNVVTATGKLGARVVTDVESETVLFVSGQVGTTGGIHVTKTADIDSVAATGGEVTFTLHVENTSNAQLEITALNDDVFGALAGDADCQVGTILAAGTGCSFTLTKHLAGTAGEHHVNVVTATGEVGNQVVIDTASESVLFVSGEVGSTGGVHVTKTADVDTVLATGGDVTFTFDIENTSNGSLEITVLSDDVFGSLVGDADCQVGTVLAPGATCSFTLMEHLSGTVGEHHVNVVTASGEVGGKTVTDVASETVLFVSAGTGGGGGVGGGGVGGGGTGGGNAGTGGQGGTSVLGAQVTRAPGSSGGLAFTGSTAWILAVMALGLFGIGLVVLAIGRRLGRVRT